MLDMVLKDQPATLEIQINQIITISLGKVCGKTNVTLGKHPPAHKS